MATKKTTTEAKTAVKATAAAVTAEVKETAKAAKKTVKAEVEAVKETAKKATAKTETYIQFFGKEIAEAEVIAKIKAAYKASAAKVPAIKTLKVYLKPEENAAYYVINDTVSGKVELF